jgi:predicted Zn-dependent peptidase
MNKLDYTALGETLYTTTLENGLPIFVVPKPGYRKSFAVFATNYGGADRDFTLAGEEKHTPAGVAHYLEHKMFDTPDGDALMTLNATGANPNAFTSEAMTAYHFECTDHFEENLKTLLSFVSVPYFTEQSVQKEQGIIGQEIRMCEDSPDYVVYTNLMQCLFAHSPLRDSVAGTVESIAQITPEVLYACHKVFYHPSNMALCVVGDVEPDTVERIAREILTPEAAEKPGRDYGPAETLEPLTALREQSMEVSAPIFLIGAKTGPTGIGPGTLKERITAGLALRCLCGRSSPFYLRLYSQGLLNTTFGSSTDYAAGQGMVAFEGETKDPQAVLQALTQEIQRVSREGFDKGLFQRQKKASLGGRIRALSNFSGLAISLVEGCFAGYQPLDSFALLDEITCADAQAWVNTYLKPERLAMSVIYPKSR